MKPVKPVVGILLDPLIWKNVRSGKTGYERIKLYNQAAKKLGLSPFYLNLHHISLRKNIAKGFMWSDGKYTLVTRPIPSVIHNRTIPASNKERQIEKRLGTISHVFNSRTRFGKYRIHRLLTESPHIRSSLPETYRFTPETLRTMTDRYSQVYVKPQRGSVGEGVYKVTRNHLKRYSIQYSRSRWSGNSKKSMIRMVRRLVGQRRYLVQQGIHLAAYKGRPYDIRVTIQRNGEGNWQVIGMVGKVARKGSHVTNVAKGGTVYKYQTLFSHSGFEVDQIRQKIETLSLHIANRLGSKIPNLSDIGLDIGVDQQGEPYFIEMNGRDQRIAFKKAKLIKTWYRTFETPLRYARYILNKDKIAVKNR